MANLLFCDLRRRRRARKFRTGTQFEIDDFTDEELRARYRFKRESILFIITPILKSLMVPVI